MPRHSNKTLFEACDETCNIFSCNNVSILATFLNTIKIILQFSIFDGLGTASLLILVSAILDSSREIRSVLLSNVHNNMLN